MSSFRYIDVLSTPWGKVLDILNLRKCACINNMLQRDEMELSYRNYRKNPDEYFPFQVECWYDEPEVVDEINKTNENFEIVRSLLYRFIPDHSMEYGRVIEEINSWTDFERLVCNTHETLHDIANGKVEKWIFFFRYPFQEATEDAFYYSSLCNSKIKRYDTLIKVDFCDPDSQLKSSITAAASRETNNRSQNEEIILKTVPSTNGRAEIKKIPLINGNQIVPLQRKTHGIPHRFSPFAIVDPVTYSAMKICGYFDIEVKGESLNDRFNDDYYDYLVITLLEYFYHVIEIQLNYDYTFICSDDSKSRIYKIFCSDDIPHYILYLDPMWDYIQGKMELIWKFELSNYQISQLHFGTLVDKNGSVNIENYRDGVKNLSSIVTIPRKYNHCIINSLSENSILRKNFNTRLDVEFIEVQDDDKFSVITKNGPYLRPLTYEISKDIDIDFTNTTLDSLSGANAYCHIQWLMNYFDNIFPNFSSVFSAFYITINAELNTMGARTAVGRDSTNYYFASIEFFNDNVCHTALDRGVIIHEFIHILLDVQKLGDSFTTSYLTMEEAVCDFIACVLENTDTFCNYCSRESRRGPFTNSNTKISQISLDGKNYHNDSVVISSILMKIYRDILVQELVGEPAIFMIKLVITCMNLISNDFLPTFLNFRDQILHQLKGHVKNNQLKQIVWKHFASHGLGTGAVINLDACGMSYDEIISSYTLPVAVEKPKCTSTKNTIKVEGNIISHAYQNCQTNQICRLNNSITSPLFPMKGFEIEIKSVNSNGVVAIGLSDKTSDIDDKQPGWFKNSIGLHNDDGKLYCNNLHSSLALKACDPFGENAKVRCFLSDDLSEVYFMVNEREVARKTLQQMKVRSADMLYPVIGIDGATIQVNIPKN